MKCVICGNINIFELRKIENIKIFVCRKCELGFLDRNDIKNLNPNHFYDLHAYKKITERLTKRFYTISKIINKIKSEGKVLDVGGGYGLLDSILIKTGNYTITLVEPFNKPVFANMENVFCIKRDFEEYLNDTDKKFDIIIMFDVIEHFVNPFFILKRIKNLLKPDGIIVIQTPNYRSLMQYVSKKWSWWMIEDHKFFFSPKSIRFILKRSGFKTFYFKTYEDWYDFRKNIDEHFRRIKYSLLRKLIKSFSLIIIFLFYFSFRHTIWSLEKGGLILLIAAKNIK